MAPDAGRIAAGAPYRRWLPAVVACAGLVATACGGGPSPQPDSTPGTLPSRAAGAAPQGPSQLFATGATLTIGLAGEPANWNPLAAPGPADPALAAVVDAVLPSAFAGGGGPAPLLSSATETPAAPGTPQTVVYTINPRATWSDGVPITAADFIYTWQAESGRTRFRDRDGRAFTPASTAAYAPVSSVTSGPGDADRVVVRFSAPDPDWQALFAPILAADVARAVGFDHGFVDPVTSLVSGGPFLVQSYQPGRDVVLVRNPLWWGPTANLAELDIAFVDSSAEATESLEQGQLDAAVTAFTPASVAALRATDGLTVSVGAGTEFDDLVLDERSGPLAVRAVRLAVMLAVDRQALAAQAASSGDTAGAPVGNRSFAPGATGYEDDSGVLGPAATAVAHARTLLAAAGYVTRGSTLTHGGGPVRFTLAVATASPLAAAETAAIVAACRSLGITVLTRAVAPPAAGRHDNLMLVEAPLAPSPEALAAMYGTGGAANLAGYSSAVMDDLLARLATAASTTERVEITDQVDALAWNDAVDLPLLAVPTVLAYQSRYVNLTAAASVAGVSDDVARWGIPLSP